MRDDPATFAGANLTVAKSPRFVIRAEFDSYALYLTSHDDITGLEPGSGVLLTEDDEELTTESGLSLDGDTFEIIEACLLEPSISSQKLNPDQGRAEIGAASFVVVDLEQAFTVRLRELLAAGDGLRDKLCRFYLGFEGMAFADFVLVGTQIVKSVVYDRGTYRVSCNDIQRSARKDIFELKTTTISTTVEATDTTINVYSTAGFQTLVHGASYSDAAGETVGYIKIKDEVVRYTGTTPTSFTGCTRGVLGTTAARYVADGGTPASRRERVTEYVYLELPGPKLAYAILTGVVHTGATLPTGWHLGIPASLVKLADFTGIGSDLWDTGSDEAGIVLRFEGLAKTDGKAFLETEICRLLGLYMPVYASGELGLRRMTRVLADASSILTLDESNSVQVDELEHDMESLHNAFQVLWNWNGKDYTRTTTYLDATSAAVHGPATTMELKFKGLYGGRHTDTVIYRLLDSIRDRYSAPPLRLRVNVLHLLNRLEVGDVVRVAYRAVRDYVGAGDHIDRAFEVQSVTVNHRTGNVSLDLFGSTSRAAIDSPTGYTTSLPDAFYTSSGTDLDSVMTITDGVVSGGPYTLAGTTTLTSAASIWYYDGDLTIPSTVTVNVTGNVQLRVKGYLTVNGTINGVAGGWAGVADNGTTTVIAGNPGFVGNARGNDGVARVNISDDFVKIKTQPCALTQATHAAFPFVQLEVVGTALNGLPSDLRGTGGGPGGKVVHATAGTFYKNGGTGGTGGAGLCTISRGFGIGANGKIDLSGNSTDAPSAYNMVHEGNNIPAFPGAGGAGGPGSYLLLIDGDLSVPDLAGRFVSRSGTVRPPSSYKTALSGYDMERFTKADAPFAGYLDEPSVISAQDFSFSASRIQYVPPPEVPYADPTVIPGSTVYAVATPGAASARSASSSLTTNSVTASLVGDTATTYAWSRVSGSTSIAADSATSAATTFSATGVTSGQTISAVFRCTVNSAYTVDVPVDVTNSAAGSVLAASASPTSVSKSEDSASITTASVTVSASGGASPYTYAWTKLSGGSISITSSSSASTTFSASGLSAAEARSAVMRCTVTDSGSPASTTTVDVTVTITRSSFSVALSPTSLYKSGSVSTLTTGGVTAASAGGGGGYTYAWTKVSGDTITINSASSATTTFSASLLGYGESRTATFRCASTDVLAATATADIEVTIERFEYSGGSIER